MNLSRIDECLSALSSVIGNKNRVIGLHEPTFEGNEWEYVKSCLDSGWVSSVGEFVTRFEKKIAEYTGIPYVVAVVNGTAALHIALILAGVQAEDEVLIPSLTFVATANAVKYCNAIPHFVDSSPVNLGIDVEKLRIYLQKISYFKDGECFNKVTTRRIKVIVPVHVFGHPVDMHPLQQLAKDFNLKIVEDASESLGSYYKGQHTGSFGELACLSFNGNKIITTGGGGAILTKDAELAKRAKYLTTTAKSPHRWEFYHDEIGFNYRLPNINAALGCAQIEKLSAFLQVKRILAQRYQDAFQNVNAATILKEQTYSTSNYWLNGLILKLPNKDLINELIERASKEKFMLRGLWMPLDMLPMYQSCPKMDLENAHTLYHSVVALPSSPSLFLPENTAVNMYPSIERVAE